jgi:hypothetical protein
MNRGTVLQAEQAARVIPATLSKRGLRPLFSDWLLTEAGGCAWLFGVLDVGKVQKLEDYTRPDLLHHLSTALGGRPVFLSNSNGLRYAVLLTKPPRLPRKVDFPGIERGRLRLGQRAGGGEVLATWADMKHILVAGMTGAGKSAFLRLLVYQALGDGARLLLADRDGATFPMLADHPALLAPIAQDPESMHAILERGMGECDARAAQFGQVDGFPDDLEEYNALAQRQGAPVIPRLVVVLDEFNAVALATGGARGPLATAAAELGWRGRKFGVSFAFAAQDFTKAIVGRVRDQVGAVVCFKVRSAETARAVGCAEAVQIPAGRPGLALTDRWGAMQAYYLDKRELITAGSRPGAVLSETEAALVEAAMGEGGGYMTLAFLEGEGMGQRDARRLLEDWRARGWLEKDAERGNAHQVTPKLAALLTNRQTRQSPTDPTNLDKAQGER